MFSLLGISESLVREISESCLRSLQAWAPNLAEELPQVAAYAQLEMWKLAALNARTEILSVAPPKGASECSTAVFVPLEGGAPQTIQTWDWLEAMCPDGLIYSYVPDAPVGGRRVDMM